MTVLNINVTHISTKKFRQLQYNVFLNLLFLSIAEFHWIQNVLSILLHRTNLSCQCRRFSHLVVTVAIKSNNAKTAVKSLLHHWIIKFGPPVYLVTDHGSEYNIADMALSLDKRTHLSSKQEPWYTPSYVPSKHSKRLGSTSPYECL